MNKYEFQIPLEWRVVASLAERRKVILQAPTGAGKTKIAVSIAKSNLHGGCRVWFMCHRRELIDQTSVVCAKADLEHGFIRGDLVADPRLPLQICSVQSAGLKWREYPTPDLIIWDEAQHVAAPMWARLLESFPNARHLGLTATPERLDGKPLGEWFEHLVEGPSSEDLERAGVLAPCRVFAPTLPDLAKFRVRNREYVRGEIESAMTGRALIGDVVAHYQRLAHGRKALIFAVSIEASRAVVERFNQAGISAVHIDTDTPKAQRDKRMADFRAGRITILSAVEVFAEGVDVPSIGAVILLRPTKSLALYLQMIGRGRRVSAHHKDLIVLDHAGLFYDHGAPNDPRVWSLNRRRPPTDRAAGSARMRRCPECGAVHIAAPVCEECGHQYSAADRSISELFGELVEVKSAEGCEGVAEFAARAKIAKVTLYRYIRDGLPTRARGLIPVEDGLRWIADKVAKHKAYLAEQMRLKRTDREFNRKRAERHAEFHADPDAVAASVANRVYTEKGTRKKSETAKRVLSAPETRSKINEFLKSPANRKRASAVAKRVFGSDEGRKAQSERTKNWWRRKKSADTKDI